MQPIVDPPTPYLGPIKGGLNIGTLVRIQGYVSKSVDRFNINFHCGTPPSDIALHISVRILQNYVARNSLENGSWGDEESDGVLPIGPDQSFEIIVLCDPQSYKIALNGQHFCEFKHRLPYRQVNHMEIDGDVSLKLISIEEAPIPTAPPPSAGREYGYGPPPYNQHRGEGPPRPGYEPIPMATSRSLLNQPPPVNMPMPTSAPLPPPVGVPLPTVSPLPPYRMPPSPYNNISGGVGANPPYHHPNMPMPSSVPPYYQPNMPMPPPLIPPYHQSNMPAATSISNVPNLMPGTYPLPAYGQGQPYPEQGYPNQYGYYTEKPDKKMKKKLKKAAKYGIPIAAAGLGAYAISRAVHRSSSSSSSSSDSD